VAIDDQPTVWQRRRNNEESPVSDRAKAVAENPQSIISSHRRRRRNRCRNRRKVAVKSNDLALNSQTNETSKHRRSHRQNTTQYMGAMLLYWARHFRFRSRGGGSKISFTLVRADLRSES